jgi:hypothetical protein
MVEEVVEIIEDISRTCGADIGGLNEAQKHKVAMYLEIVRDTLVSQGSIVDSYEGIAKKLEAQIAQCQDALDESTRRETDQLAMILSLKAQYDKLDPNRDDDGDECEVCENFEEENAKLREEADMQGEAIERLSKGQELLMMQYKLMELGLNKELLAIQKT